MRIISFLSIYIFILTLCSTQLATSQTVVDSLEALVGSTSDKQVKTGALFELCSLLRKDDGDKALQYGLQALTLIDTLKTSEEHAHVFRNIAHVYEVKSDLKDAERFYSKSLSMASELKLDTLKAICFERLGVVYYRTSQFPKALMHVDSSISIHEKSGNRAELAVAVNMKGVIYLALADYPKALRFFENSMKMSEELDDNQASANASMNIGLIHSNLNDTDKAITYFERSLEYSNKADDKLSMARVLINLGNLQTKLGDTEKGLKHLVSATEILEELAIYDEYLGAIETNIAALYLTNEDFNSAYIHSKKALLKLKPSEQTPPYVVGLVQLGRSLAGMGQKRAAVDQYLKALDIATSLGLEKHLVTINKLLATAYDEFGDHKNSHQYFVDYISHRDSVINQNKLAEIAETRLEFEFAKEQLADSLQYIQELNTQQLEIDKKRTQQRWFILGLILLAALLGLLYYAYSIKSKANEVIAKEKEEANLQKEQAEKQRERAEQSELKLQELDSLKTRLYTNITHEFRTPLTVILGIVRQFIDSPEQMDEKGLAMVERNGENLLSLINQMLDLSKLESGNLALNQIQDDLISYIKYLVESIHSLAETKNLTINFHSDVRELQMDFDPERIKQILFNLLSNAIKFTPEGGDIEVQLQKNHSSRDELLEMTVSNSGPGISPDQLPHVFDRFYQVDDTTTRDNQGSGIGLALVKELVKLKGGEITVESAAEKGTSFMLTLPITTMAEKYQQGEPLSDQRDKKLTTSVTPTETSEQVTPSEDTPNQALPLLLLIEDNDDVLSYLTSVLQEDYTIKIGKNGQEGIDLAIEHVPDLIISDVMMPIKDGYEVCQTLKQDDRTSHVPIIMLTAKADIDSKLEGLEFGADDYLAKPFHKKELLTRIKNLLSNRKKLQQYYASKILHTTTEKDSKELNINVRENEFLTRIREIVNTNFTDVNFTTEQFCKEVNMSRSQLQRKLSALTNLSPNRYIRHIRLNKAQELLRDETLTIKEVVYRIGMDDPSYFSRLFKKEFGLSPLDWRRSVGSRVS